jgi:DNA repair exonuclease SbcCD ATPase subunit
MKLKKLKISNFKGLRSLEVSFAGTTIISGANATGKSTIYDAYLWLLFGKNSEGRSDFPIKPYNENGQPETNIEVSVEAEFDSFKLRRSLHEKWNKKRGAGQSELTGHETQYQIDDIDVSATKYNEFVSSIIDESKFRILSDVFAFQDLHWAERRKLLSELVDEQGIRSNVLQAFQELAEKLQKYSISELRQSLRNQRNAIKDEVDKYPVRIETLKSQMPDLSGVNDAKQKIYEIDGLLEALSSQIKAAEARSREKMRQYEAALAEKNKIKARISQIDADIKAKKYEIEAKRSAIDTRKSSIRREIDNFRQIIAENTQKIDNLNKKLAELRQQWAEETTKSFVPADNLFICFNCGQRLPDNKALEIADKAKAKFNEEKRMRIAEIEQSGKSTKASIERLTAENQQLEAKITQLEKELEQLNVQAVAEADVTAEMARLSELNKQLEEFVLPNVEADNEVASLEGKRKALYEERLQLREIISAEKQAEQLRANIQQLEASWKADSQQLLNVEQMLIRLDDYEEAYSKELEQAVNANIAGEGFEIRMFRKLLNGNIEATCDIYYHGVPIQSVNNGHRIVFGIKMIDLLSKLYNVQVPVFVDNAESVNDWNLPNVNYQLILLKVTEDKKLNVLFK